MKIIDYTYYKIFKCLEKSSLWNIARFASGVYLGGLISLNILEILVLAAKQDLILFPTTNKFIIGAFCMANGIFFALLYNGKRSKKVIVKFDYENKSQKLLGNIVFWSYIIFSCFLTIITGLFKPGYLPTKW